MAEQLTLGEMRMEWCEQGFAWQTCTDHRQAEVVRILLGTKEYDPDCTTFATGMGGSCCKYHLIRVNRPSREYPGGSLTFQPVVRNGPYGRRPNVKCRMVRCGEVIYNLHAEIKGGRLSCDCYGAMDGDLKVNFTFPVGQRITAGRILAAVTRTQLLHNRITKYTRIKLVNNSVVLKKSFTVWSPAWTSAVRIRLIQ